MYIVSLRNKSIAASNTTFWKNEITWIFPGTLGTCFWVFFEPLGGLGNAREGSKTMFLKFFEHVF